MTRQPVSSRMLDVTLPIAPGMLTYPGDPAVRVDRVEDMANGDVSNLSVLSMSAHTGTHVDAPRHFVAEGATIDRIPIHVLVGKAFVADMRGVSAIGVAELEAAALPLGVERLFFLTDWSSRWSERSPSFPDRYTAVTPDGARWLTDHGVRLVGTDFLSIEGPDDLTYTVHRTLLGAGAVVVEGLDLRDVLPGAYTVWCLPLKLKDGDGGPARVLLVAG